MYGIGSIIIVEYQIFKNNGIYEMDHVKRRPVVVIAEDDEKFYYLTLSSKDNPKYPQYKINNNSYAKIQNIYSKKIYGAVEKEKLSNKQLRNLLIELCNFNEGKNNPDFKKIEKLVLLKIKELTLTKEIEMHKR